MRRRRPSAATMIACVALFVASGGTAIAASRYVITSTSQIKPTALSALQAPGPDKGAWSPEMSLKPGEHGTEAIAKCPAGYHVLSGGYYVELAAGAYVFNSQPDGTSGWTMQIDNEGATGPSKGWARALCAPGRVAYVSARVSFPD